MPETTPPLQEVPESRAVSRKRTRLSLVWIIPILAAAVGAWVAVTRILGEGPSITIDFQSAEGLEAGKTTIQFNGVQVGTLTKIRLSDDHGHVIATAQMAPKTEDFLVEGTEFWVVRPRISGANVTGLGTLISGSYVGMEIGSSKKSKRHFTALEDPPVVTGDVPGRFFTLRTSSLGSLDTGTPVYFRHLSVGEVSSYTLSPDGESLTVKIFVNAPYDKFVTANTRFWHASGIDVSLTASGLTVETQSFLSILIGGIAFEAPPSTRPDQPPAEADSVFTLFRDRENAFKLPSLDPQTYVLDFTQSVRGLTIGAPVDFRGIPIGEVVDIQAVVDAKTLEFSVPVTIQIDASRLGVKLTDLEGVDLADLHRTLVDSMVAHGVRAQLQSGSLLTGALFIALDFFPDAPPATVDWSQKPVRLPTIPGELQTIEASVASIIKKIDDMPLEAIGKDLQKAIVELDQTLVSTRAALDSANRLIEPNSVLSTELDDTLQEVSRAARSLRVLTDYLERHPEALLRGKTGGAE